jgi:glucose/arabinose dehydrogenase
VKKTNNVTANKPLILFGIRPLLALSTLVLLVSISLTQCTRPVASLPDGDPGNGGLFLPEGFEAMVVVDSLKGRARHMAVNDNGDIYVKLRFPQEEGGNVALRDTNNDGRADIVKIFGDYHDKGNYGTAMRIYDGYLYFSSELNVYRQKLTPGKLIPEGELEVILRDDHEHGRHEHIAKPVSFDDKGYMYVPFGAPSNNCQEKNRTPNSPGLMPCPQLEDHGGIWRFDAHKTGQTQKDGTKYATGLRSIVGMDWNKEDKTLYVVHHGRDDLLRLWPNIYSAWQSAVLPSEEFIKVKEGTDAGWPYYYYDHMLGKRVLNPEYGGDSKITEGGEKYDQPVMGFPGHWAPNDLFFYTGDQFPERYKNGAFIAFHGATNRIPYPQSGYFIGFIPFRNGAPTGEWEVFADGFAQVDPIANVSDAVYRPMGIAMGPDGDLYLSDTEKGKIWRVMYKGSKSSFGPTQLSAMENRKLLSHIRDPHEVEDDLTREQTLAGAKLYTTYCATCHQQNGLGDGQRFPPLAGAEWVTQNKKRLINVVLNGLEGPIEVKGQAYTGVMPQHSFLSDEEVSQVLTFIRQSFGNNAGGISAAEVAAVRNSTPNP